jgi:hypothetical protein
MTGKPAEVFGRLPDLTIARDATDDEKPKKGGRKSAKAKA